MTAKKFRDCGGIKCLHDIKLRCVVTDRADGGHWLWRMTTMHRQGSTPMCQTQHAPHRMSTRRAAWMLAGKLVPAGHVVYGACTEPLCVNPAHSKCGTREDAVKHQASSGAFFTPKRKAASLRRAQARRQLSDDQVRSILRDPRPASAISAEMGISRQTVSAIKRRDQYADVLLGADVFSLAQSGMFSRLVAIDPAQTNRRAA